MTTQDPFNARATLSTGAGPLTLYRLDALEKAGIAGVNRLPVSIKIMLEQALRQLDGFQVTEEDVRNIAGWKAAAPGEVEIPFKPSRVVLQDFTGVPAVVDLAALRSAMQRLGGDPKRINPQVPVDLVIDHSVQVDRFGSSFALMYNADREFERNNERYEFLRWGTEAFDNFRVVPPATGIVHQVNLEYLATVVEARSGIAFPDTLVGTDSHTTMINGLGVVGWGVGGIEAEAAMLGQPMYMLLPEVIGFRLLGALPQGATATDLVLTVTQMLRRKGVVNKFVEFYGAGLSSLSLADRATIANMAPEYGATIGYFPVDVETLAYLDRTGRSPDVVARVEAYCKEQGLFRTDDTPDPTFTDTLELDLSTVEPSLAGPKRPQDRVPLKEASASFHKAWSEFTGDAREAKRVPVSFRRDASEQQIEAEVSDGAVVIAAITSCTNTSNPSVMVGAGLLAKKARQKGLRVPAHVKTSLAPGSKVVTRYLDEAGLTTYLDELNFHTVGYGCTTCIGNSGPIDPAIEQAVRENNLVVAAVLSGNRNFEGRVHPVTRTNYLASPPLVVAYALAGRMDLDLTTEPIGQDEAGDPVYLRDIWPTPEEVRETVAISLKREMYIEEYGNVFTGNERWNAIPVTGGDLYSWVRESTYIQEPPFFVGISTQEPDISDLSGARCLALLGDSVTTDHISPAGDIALNSPAGQYLQQRGIEKVDFNSYGSRRGNHEVMMRGTFANIRLKNLMLPGTEGGVAVRLPAGAGSAAEGQQMSIYDAAMQYQAEGVPLVIVAGQEYGTGSSRDWAAKGAYLLGVRAVIAESFERIHRSNLVFMGVLPLQFRPGENAKRLGLNGFEVYEISGLNNDLKPRQELTVKATRADGTAVEFRAICRIDTPVEVQYYRNRGILHTVLRGMLKG